jgi:hypothetical protein
MTEASRVQKLLIEQNAEIDRLKNKVVALEAALTHIYTWYPTSLFNPHQTIKDIKEFARKALEGKDG